MPQERRFVMGICQSIGGALTTSKSWSVQVESGFGLVAEKKGRRSLREEERQFMAKFMVCEKTATVIKPHDLAMASQSSGYDDLLAVAVVDFYGGAIFEALVRGCLLLLENWGWSPDCPHERVSLYLPGETSEAT